MHFLTLPNLLLPDIFEKNSTLNILKHIRLEAKSITNIYFNAKAGAACPGDSGSPLVTYHEQNGGWTLICLLSNGAKSCFKGLPEVYTKVGDYLDWIHTTISENSLHNIQVYP